MRFFLIDRITRWDIGSCAEGIKNVSLSEDFFDDHFPRHPIMPGVLILEGIAQLSGLLLEESLKERFDRSAKAVLSILERTKFRHMVRPGDTLRYEATIASLQETAGKTRSKAVRGDQVIVTTEMLFVFQEVEDASLEERKRVLLDIWLRRDD